VVFDSICHTRFVWTVHLLAVYLLALKPINPKVVADIHNYFYFNVYACMYVGQLFPFVCEELHSMGHWQTGCYRLIHRSGVS
jgi:hypothetical protein